jgi:predicted amidohydrolase YtcJ
MTHLMRPGLWFLAALVGLSACAVSVAAPPRAALNPAQSLLFYNGAVLTIDPAQLQAEALLVEGDQIAVVGSEADVRARAGAGTVLIDLEGRALMPGFVDAHTHVLNDARSQEMSLDQAQTLALRNGITTIGDLYVDSAFLREIQAFEAAGALRLRTSLYLVHTDPCGRDQGTWWQAHPPTRVPGERLRIGGVKIFTDGGSCGAVALSFEHNDQHGGDLWWTQDELSQMVAEVQAAGHQAALHAIGDRAVAQAQTAVAAALNGQPNTFRHRLEHVSVLPPELVDRFGELGLVAVLPGQYQSCAPFGPPLPEAYGAWEWPWRTLRERNPAINIGWHSDYPFWSISPFVHLYGFVTRRDVYNGYYTCAPQPWLQDDTLTIEQALSIMTIQSAYALFRETEVGSLAPGKYADLIVLSGNPLTVPPEDLRRLSVLMTMVGGEVEHVPAPRYPSAPATQRARPSPCPICAQPCPSAGVSPRWPRCCRWAWRCGRGAVAAGRSWWARWRPWLAAAYGCAPGCRTPMQRWKAAGVSSWPPGWWPWPPPACWRCPAERACGLRG